MSLSSPLYICYLDASKAFDRINFWLLFEKLLDRDVPNILVRFLMVWYSTQEFVVRWGSTLSTSFRVTNGVRQGGIMSPLLFNVYVDGLSDILNKSNVGCIMNGTFINHLIYADDTVLIAPSAHALQILLKHCDIYAIDCDIIYNAKKTVCMCIRPRIMKNHNDPIVILSGNILHYVSSYKYLGVLISSNMKDDPEISNQCRNLYGRGNIIIKNFKQCSDEVKCQLFQSFCTSFYCVSLWSVYTAESLRRMRVAYNRVFRILLGLEHKTSMSEAFIIRGLNPFSVIVRKLIVGFRQRLLNSTNILVRTVIDSMFFVNCQLVNGWNKTIFKLRETG